VQAESTIKLAPSLASAPLDRLGEVVSDLNKSGVEYIHFDVEDGFFTPVMTLGTKIIRDLRPWSKLPFDVHLMMVNPEWILPRLKDYGADRIAVHYEACPYPRRTLRKIVDLGIIPGLAFNPTTAIPEISYLKPYLEFIILLSTEPEEPDCPFIPETLDKLVTGKKQTGLGDIEWVVDGGVNETNIKDVAASGADTVVVGRGAFRDGNLKGNIRQLREQIR
jgi:ribulose-phosphate 3-epimerase